MVPVGGGGLIAGSATAAKALHPGIRVIGVEPEAGDDTKRSLDSGARVTIPVPRTIADGQALPTPGELTFSSTGAWSTRSPSSATTRSSPPCASPSND